MCGIAGIIDFAGRPVDERLLQTFCRSLRHRGPDDAGVWRHESSGFSVGLAHSRLAVIDPSPDARQPMTDPSGRYAVTYNGELYNYRQLRQELPGPFRSASDTEVALQACIAWGPEAVRRFDAMWAMAFVDVHERIGHLSRDPVGIKPLYYLHHDHRLIFASELATLRCVPDLPMTIDPQAVACYLNLGYIPHPQTIYRDIYKLAPGHLLRFDATGPESPQRYHHLRQPAEPSPPFPDAARELKQRIETAVADQRVADVPLGAFLSGGLDSAVVVACLSRVSDIPVKTFSIGYADHPRYDETAYAEMVARHLGTEHHAFHLTFRDVLDTIEPMLDHLGEPFADSSLLPTSLVSKHTREYVTVALSGDGGDELFAGYWRYVGHHYLARYHKCPRVIRKGLIEPLLRVIPSARSTPRLDRLRQARKLIKGDFNDPIDRHLAWARQIDDQLAANLMGNTRAQQAADQLKRLYQESPNQLQSEIRNPQSPIPNLQSAIRNPQSAIRHILLADLAIGLPGDMLAKVDTASMFHSLEVRVPLLSAGLVDFVTGLPVDYKITGPRTKRILREAFRDVLPEAVINRKKMGFEVPVGEFLRHELREMYHDLVTPAALDDFGLDATLAGRLFKEHGQRRCDHTELLWSLLVLCRWQRQRG